MTGFNEIEERLEAGRWEIGALAASRG